MIEGLFSDGDFNLWLLLVQTKDAMVVARDRELRREGTSITRSAVLFIIHALGDKAIPAEIARNLFRRSQSVSGILDRMEKDGLVVKVPDALRRNRVRVSMTEKGRRMLRLSMKRRCIHRILSPLTEEQREELVSLLSVLYRGATKELKGDRHLMALPFLPQPRGRHRSRK